MISIFDVGLIGTGIITIINLFKKKSKKRDENTKILLLIFFFFLILKLVMKT